MTTILAEAERIMLGPRQEKYGDPVETCARIGVLWGALLALPEPIPPRVVAWMMVVLKGARDTSPGGKIDPDNLVDGAAYLRIAELADERDGLRLRSELEAEDERAAEDELHARAEAGLPALPETTDAFWSDLGRPETPTPIGGPCPLRELSPDGRCGMGDHFPGGYLQCLPSCQRAARSER